MDVSSFAYLQARPAGTAPQVHEIIHVWCYGRSVTLLRWAPSLADSLASRKPRKDACVTLATLVARLLH